MLDRRAFLKGIFGVAAVAAVPKVFIDMGAAWQKREASGLWQVGDIIKTRAGQLYCITELHDELAEHWNAHNIALQKLLYNDGTGMLGRFQDHIQAHATILEG